MRSVVLHCPWLGRDISELRKRVPNLEVFYGERTAKGEDGCLQSHQAIVAGALARGEPSIFVMEDDCKFTPLFSYAWWLEVVEWAEVNRYDVLAGGCTRTYGERVVRQAGGKGITILEVSAFHSAHCVVYFRSGYEKVMKAVQPYDVSLGQTCGMRCALVHPFMAVQRASFSGILQTDVNYVPLYENHQRRLMHAMKTVPHGALLEMEAY